MITANSRAWQPLPTKRGGGNRRNNYCDFNRTFSFPNFQGDLEKGKKEFNHPRAVGVRERKWLSFPISAATATQQLQRREREKAVRKQVSVDLPLIVTFQSLEGGKRERERKRDCQRRIRPSLSFLGGELKDTRARNEGRKIPQRTFFLGRLVSFLTLPHAKSPDIVHACRLSTK